LKKENVVRFGSVFVVGRGGGGGVGLGGGGGGGGGTTAPPLSESEQRSGGVSRELCVHVKQRKSELESVSCPVYLSSLGPDARN